MTGFGNSIWTLGIPSMMKFAGKSCTTTIPGTGSITFNGILDQAELADDTEMGINIRMQSVLRVDRDVAKQLKGLVNQTITIGSIDYVANEPIFEDDGETAVLPIYPAEDDTRYGW